MKTSSEEEKLIRQYLLGRLAAEQSDPIEERFLADADFVEEVEIIENEMISDYLAGALSAQEEEHFRDHFLSVPGRAQKLKFFDALRKNIAGQPRPAVETQLSVSWKRFLPSFLRGDNPLPRYAFTAAVLLLLVGGAWAILRSVRAPGLDPGQSQLATITLTLSPGTGRAVGSGETARANLSDGVGVLKLQLQVTEGSYQSYRASLLTDEGVELSSWEDLRVQPAAARTLIAIDVPAKLLTRGDYQVKLYGRAANGEFEALDSYSFRIIRN